ncbi:lytic transglycosylase domain-containing protein [Paenibacillus sp. BC26]|uniref:lytic transglycosylase domain-containing protein n=1 Tax=Paenibacillus sp. BC26 TaxID=1881032 RepID=UPI003526FF2A
MIITLAFVVLLFVRSEWMSHWMYPVHFREDIVISANNYKLEPHLVAAIIRVETNYKTGVVSRKGAIGVMQLMPDTANWIIQKGGFGKISTEAISNRADVSIEIGAWYLNALNQQFDGNMYTVIAAYNAGPGNVSRWLADGTWDGKLETVDRVPFGETRHYIQRVIYYYNKYKALYPDLLQS